MYTLFIYAVMIRDVKLNFETTVCACGDDSLFICLVQSI